MRAIGLSAEYKKRFFETNAPYRFIELNFKHLLGRAPLNQTEVQAHIKVQAEAGFDALVDVITDSAEYAEVFGADIVPYNRSQDSYAGMFTRTFNLMRELGGNKVAISDNAQGRNSRTVNPLAIASRESTKPGTFSYRSIARTPVKLPQQQYSGHQTPKMTDDVPFRPFGVHF